MNQPVELSKYWYRIKKTDVAARQLADRHYSRQKKGARSFTPPGQTIVLAHLDCRGATKAIWASLRVAPGKNIVRYDKLDAWFCSIFHNEQTEIRSSELIREAVRITHTLWGDILPEDGFWTYIDPKKVKPTKVRGQDTWGYCYIKAGWTKHPFVTKTNKLLSFQYPKGKLALLKPMYAPLKEQQLSLDFES